MKKIIFLISILIFFCSFFTEQKNAIVGRWSLELVSVNLDTMFYRHNINSSVAYKRSLGTNDIDSNRFFQIEKGFNQMKEFFINFNLDSTFEMTKAKSGKGMNNNILDSGIYLVNKDTVTLTKQTDRIEEMKYILNKKKDTLTYESSFNDRIMIIRFAKI